MITAAANLPGNAYRYPDDAARMITAAANIPGNAYRYPDGRRPDDRCRPNIPGNATRRPDDAARMTAAALMLPTIIHAAPVAAPAAPTRRPGR